MNAAFPVTIIFSEAVQGFTMADIVVENGSITYLAPETSTTYSATVDPTTSGQAVKVTVAPGAVMDAGSNANPVSSNTLIVEYDTTKPIAVFGNFTHGQLFNVPPAAVNVSVSETLYWITGGAELDAVNALPLVSMKKDSTAFTAYTASYDALAHTFTLTFNSTLQDGLYEVEVAGNEVKNEYHNILDAAQASFTVDTEPPSVQFVTNGQATAAQSAESTVTVSDTGSGVDATSLQYVWTQSTAVPISGWTDFTDGETLSQASGDDNWYLHIRAADVAGNEVDAVSSPFVLDNTSPTATVSTSSGGMVNAAFPITITFNEDVSGFIEDDLILVNGRIWFP